MSHFFFLIILIFIIGLDFIIISSKIKYYKNYNDLITYYKEINYFFTKNNLLFI